MSKVPSLRPMPDNGQQDSVPDLVQDLVPDKSGRVGKLCGLPLLLLAPPPSLLPSLPAPLLLLLPWQLFQRRQQDPCLQLPGPASQPLQHGKTAPGTECSSLWG